jgi:hypothetical protein
MMTPPAVVPHQRRAVRVGSSEALAAPIDRLPTAGRVDRPARVGRIRHQLIRHVIGIDAAALIAAARRRSGLDDFGDPPVEEPLGVLVDALNGEAHLSLVGALATRLHLVELLDNRLRLEAAWKGIADTAPEIPHPPLFITGLPRTGTTFLHALLAEDPANRVPMHWETMFPWPAPSADDAENRPRIVKAERRLRWAERMAPRLRQIHAVGALLPQECVTITAFSLYSTQFQEMYCVPSYQRWLEAQDMRVAYRLHRRFLRHLESRQEPRPWVLKAPAHLTVVDVILDVYPDARIVQTHRDPVSVVASQCSLSVNLRSLFSRRVDSIATAATVVEDLARDVDRSLALRRRRPDLEERIADVLYDDLLARPMDVVHQIYAHLGRSLSAEAEHRMRDYLTAHPQHQHGRHDYTPAQFALETGALRERFAAYSSSYGVRHEQV